jgi:hypothetical protein
MMKNPVANLSDQSAATAARGIPDDRRCHIRPLFLGPAAITV